MERNKASPVVTYKNVQTSEAKCFRLKPTATNKQFLKGIAQVGTTTGCGWMAKESEFDFRQRPEVL
jgi:hypothetical protein